MPYPAVGAGQELDVSFPAWSTGCGAVLESFFSRAGVCGRSWDPHHFPGLAPVLGISTSLATRTSSRDPHQSRDSQKHGDLHQSLDLHQFPGSLPALGIRTSLATRTSSRNLHQSRDSRKHWDLHQFWISTSPRDPYQLSGSAPPPRIRTNLATRTSFRDLHQLSGATPALGIHTASGRLDWVQIPKTGAVVGFPCVDMHQAVGGTHHPWGLPRGRRLRGNRNTSKQPSLGRSPEFVRDPLRDSATHGLTELPYGSQQLHGICQPA